MIRLFLTKTRTLLSDLGSAKVAPFVQSVPADVVAVPARLARSHDMLGTQVQDRFEALPADAVASIIDRRSAGNIRSASRNRICPSL